MRSLLENKARLDEVAAGGRTEVEKWGWGAATAKLRKQQYRRAILRHRVYNRLRNFLMKLRILRTIKAVSSWVVGLWAAMCVMMSRLLGSFDGQPPMGGMRQPPATVL